MRQKNLLQQIRDAIQLGKVTQPFRTSDFDFLSNSPSFISKHAVGNGKYNEFFVRVNKGLYKLK